jgi:hypothetical protein
MLVKSRTLVPPCGGQSVPIFLALEDTRGSRKQTENSSSNMSHPYAYQSGIITFVCGIENKIAIPQEFMEVLEALHNFEEAIRHSLVIYLSICDRDVSDTRM